MQLREECDRWLKYEILLNKPDRDTDPDWISYAEGVFETPEAPEALILSRRLQFLGVPLIAGGMLAQPHLYLLEQETVKVAEQELQLRMLANAALAAAKNKATTAD